MTQQMREVTIRKVWKIGDSIVVTIPKEVRDKAPAFREGAFVRVLTDGRRLVIVPIESSD